MTYEDSQESTYTGKLAEKGRITQLNLEITKKGGGGGPHKGNLFHFKFKTLSPLFFVKK